MTTWFNIQLMGHGDDGPKADLSILAPGSSTVVIGRYLTFENGSSPDDLSAWSIDDTILSRKQVRIVLPDAADGVRVATQLGKKSSFVQLNPHVHGPGDPEPLVKDEPTPVPTDGIIWLRREGSDGGFKHPIMIVAADAPPGAPAAAASTQAASSSSVDAPATAPAPPGEWQVWLAGKFKPYEEAAVQKALETGLFTQGKAKVKVTVRNAQYWIHDLGGGKYQQVLVSDSTKTRDVRRVAPDPPPPEIPMGQRVKSTEEELCAICLDGPRSHAFVPCGHRALCSRCNSDSGLVAALQAGSGCPICRAGFERVIRVFV